jgi:single-strand DNA-binding protein
MQSVIIEGYLAADPSILAAQGSGKTRASFRLLETVRFRRSDGEPGERTTGFNCVCFNERTAQDYIAAYARRGSRVVVSGHVENDTWTGTDGVAHFDLRVIVEALRIQSRTPRDTNDETPLEDNAGGVTGDLDDEIPC